MRVTSSPSICAARAIKFGLATGSHVCFRVTRNGRYVNPLQIHSPAGDPVTAAHASEFGRVRDSLLADLGGHPTTEPSL